jgi:RNA-directed DNA polymerase
LRGWHGYFGITQEQYRMQNLDSWIRRRLRSLQLNQWRHGRVIYQRLRALGIDDRRSRGVAQYAGRWAWLTSHHANSVLPNRYFTKLGLYFLFKK